jgi:hypothetical protein
MNDLRAAALALPEMTEAPHFMRTSFRVNGRIVAQDTERAGEAGFAIVNVPLGQAEILVEVRPDVFDFATWGAWRGLRVRLEAVDAQELAELVGDAWERIAPKKLQKLHTLQKMHGGAGQRVPAGPPAVS